MKAVILCGGLGTRISSETAKKPKPMIKIGKIPILEHIINICFKNNIDEIIVLLGYKGNIIKNYFKRKEYSKKIKFIETGLKTLTGERILKIKKLIKKNENFMVTYGDGLSNVNLKKLLKFHLKQKKIATLTAVRPPARFGEIYFKKNHIVKNFQEKQQISSGWINGGFIIFSSRIFKYLKKKEMLERQPMKRLLKSNNLTAYKHEGFWQCMDTMRDKTSLENLIKKSKILPWMK